MTNGDNDVLIIHHDNAAGRARQIKLVRSKIKSQDTILPKNRIEVDPKDLERCISSAAFDRKERKDERR